MPEVDDLIGQLLGRGERIPAQKRRRLAELALVFVRGLNGTPFLAQRSRCWIVGEPINNRIQKTCESRLQLVAIDQRFASFGELQRAVERSIRPPTK